MTIDAYCFYLYPPEACNTEGISFSLGLL